VDGLWRRWVPDTVPYPMSDVIMNDVVVLLHNMETNEHIPLDVQLKKNSEGEVRE